MKRCGKVFGVFLDIVGVAAAAVMLVGILVTGHGLDETSSVTICACYVAIYLLTVWMRRQHRKNLDFWQGIVEFWKNRSDFWQKQYDEVRR